MSTEVEENKVLVSVIVPVYNVEDYLEECIASIRRQTYTEIEIILIDDGSTDTSSALCDSISREDYRIRVIHKKNGGLSSARNAGMEVAKGKYYLFVDSDDIISETMVHDLVLTAETGGYKMVVSRITLDVKNLYSGGQPERIVKSAKAVLESILAERCISTSASGKLYDASLWNDIRFPEGRIFEDYATVYKTVIKSEKICFVDACHYYYRQNPKGITRSPFTDKKMDYYVVTDLVRQDLKKLQYDDLLPILNNRTVRYSISFYRDISKSKYYNDANCDFIVKTIRKHMFRYLFSQYKFTSKMFGVVISISPGLARWMFQP